MTQPLSPTQRPQEARSPRIKMPSLLLLASLNRRSENVIVKAIIVPELELRNVKMQILFADVVECTDHAAFDKSGHIAIARIELSAVALRAKPEATKRSNLTAMPRNRTK